MDVLLVGPWPLSNQAVGDVHDGVLDPVPAPPDVAPSLRLRRFGVRRAEPGGVPLAAAPLHPQEPRVPAHQRNGLHAGGRLRVPRRPPMRAAAVGRIDRQVTAAYISHDPDRRSADEYAACAAGDAAPC